MIWNEEQQLFNYALRLLGRREYSRAELKTKLTQRLKHQKSFSSQTEQDIESLLERLSLDGVQDDDRFAASYVRLGIMKGWGPIKISYHLKKRGISEEKIAKHCHYEEAFWLKQICQLIKNRYGTINETNREQSYRFLLGRGFRSDQIRQAFLDLSDFA